MTSMRGCGYSFIATFRLLVMMRRSSWPLSARATSSVVVPILMKSELLLVMSWAAATPIARFSSAAIKRRAS